MQQWYYSTKNRENAEFAGHEKQKPETLKLRNEIVDETTQKILQTVLEDFYKERPKKQRTYTTKIPFDEGRPNSAGDWFSSGLSETQAASSPT